MLLGVFPVFIQDCSIEDFREADASGEATLHMVMREFCSHYSCRQEQFSAKQLKSLGDIVTMPLASMTIWRMRWLPAFWSTCVRSEVTRRSLLISRLQQRPGRMPNKRLQPTLGSPCAAEARRYASHEHHRLA